ncbi:MAG: NADH-quinone oxidoreductase subunit L [Dehalococcoidia bacterium]
MIGVEQAWLLPVIPLGSFVILAFFHNYLPRKGDVISVGAIFASFVLFFFVLADAVRDYPSRLPGVSGYEWITAGRFRIDIGFSVDQISLVMLFVVTLVALMVNIYSTGYMKERHGLTEEEQRRLLGGDGHDGHDVHGHVAAEHVESSAGHETAAAAPEPRYGWFFACLSLFAFSMLTLVLADNLLLMYAAWELVGLCSFLLIGFYWERRSAAEAAKKAFITTRIGDVGMLIGIIMLWRATGTFNIREIIEAAESGAISHGYLVFASLALLLGPIGKSAQVPLHVWLPDAMEGPTPVSALIHAATMVVAGIYLVARMLPVFEVAEVLTVILTIGMITALFAAIVALAQTDIKKVIAYSTLSNLGIMMVALGLGSVTAAMFHLMTHAFFKACLFLGSGSVIHATHTQEMPEMGGLFRKMKITGTTFTIAALANAGIIPLAGFWSKDEILHALSFANTTWFVLALVWVLLSGIYTARLVYYSFFGAPRSDHAAHAHESPFSMTSTLLILAFLSIVAGFVVIPSFAEGLGLPGGFGALVFNALEGPEEWHFAPDLAVAGTVAGVFGLLFALYMVSRPSRVRRLTASMPSLYALVKNKFYFDEMYQWLIDRVVLVIAYGVAWFDRNIINDTGVDGTSRLTSYLGFRAKFAQTGRIPNYALAIVVGVLTLAVIALSTRS